MTGKPSSLSNPQGRKAGPSPPKRHKTTRTETSNGNKSDERAQKGLSPPPPPPRVPPRALPRPWPTPFAAAKERQVVTRGHQKTPVHSNRSTNSTDTSSQSSKKRPKFPTPPSPLAVEKPAEKTKAKGAATTPQIVTPKKTPELKKKKQEPKDEASRTFLTLKLRFTPELEYRHYGASNLRKHDNPVIMHLRKFMQRCIDVTGKDIVFKTFTSEKEFDYAYCLKDDKAAAEELLAHPVEKQRHTHEMLVKLEIGIPLP